jgi:hypothetical protein
LLFSFLERVCDAIDYFRDALLFLQDVGGREFLQSRIQV